MPLKTLLNPERICIDDTAQSKTAALLKVSQLMSVVHPEITTEHLFDDFWQREALGSTGIGNGILLPHIRSHSIQKSYGCFLKLLHPIDFGAEDKQPIDLILGLLVPNDQEEEHLKVLSNLVKLFNTPYFLKQCRLFNHQAQLARWLLETHIRVPENQMEIIEG